MEIIDRKEHEQCRLLDKSNKPLIELVRIAKQTSGELNVTTNEIVFIMQGRIRLIFTDFPEFEGVKGQILFIPAGGQYAYSAQPGAILVIFRVHDPIQLCDNFSMEKLYNTKKKVDDNHIPHTRSFSVLEINARIWHFLDGINDCLTDGLRCRKYFELKINEFFLLLRIYYTKEDIFDFLYLILSKDTAFSEYVRLYWYRFRNVEEIADSMHLTPRQFSAKFKKVFNQTPYKWMKEGRAKLIRQQFINTQKPVKQIALENGFSDMAQFTKFCKKELGNTPTQLKGNNSL